MECRLLMIYSLSGKTASKFFLFFSINFVLSDLKPIFFSSEIIAFEDYVLFLIFRIGEEDKLVSD